jgi:antitoxin (DNA-binding transcriptional repressor) of toxin-antitoxin stability system
MRQIGAFEAKNTLGTLLDLVESGEEVVITRHGRPVARLVRENLRRDPTAALEAVTRIRRRAETQGSSFDWEEWKDFRDEGRL